MYLCAMSVSALLGCFHGLDIFLHEGWACSESTIYACVDMTVRFGTKVYE